MKKKSRRCILLEINPISIYKFSVSQIRFTDSDIFFFHIVIRIPVKILVKKIATSRLLEIYPISKDNTYLTIKAIKYIDTCPIIR